MNYFSGRKGSESISVSILCQRPLLNTSVAEGCIPIHLGHVTTFGLWLMDQVVLDCHQRRSSMPMYRQESRVGPQKAFKLVEDIVVVSFALVTH